MNLRINAVYSWKDALWRIIHIDEDHCMLYPLGSGSTKYETLGVNALASEIDSGLMKEAADPYETLRSAAVGEAAQKRWTILKDLVEDSGILFSAPSRAARINEIASKHSTYKYKVYRLLALWWEKGQCQAALNTVYKKGEHKAGSGKTGPQSKLSKNPPVDDAMKVEFEKAYRKYLLKENPCKVRKAYKYFLGDYRTAHPEEPTENYPTLWQFRYHFKKSHGRREVQQKQNRPAVYEKDMRPLESSVYAIVNGPGMRYEIDSTVADVSLVSETDRTKPIGRPILYVVSDTYTGLIVGIKVTLDNAQFKCAGDALYNAFTDKEAQCAKAGVALQKDEWPAYGLPMEIVADNAELERWKIETFGERYGVLITNTSPYRADQKGTVESLLGVLQDNLRGITPGVPEKKSSKKSGYREMRTKAVLTLSDYRKLVIMAALQANRRPKEIVPPGLGQPPPSTPLNIWRKAEQLGKVRLVDPGDLGKLRLTLLPEVKCTISRKGIKAEGIRYRCAKASDAGFFDRHVDGERNKDGKLAYDPADISVAWYFPEPEDSPQTCWECTLADESKFLEGCCWSEAQTLLESAREEAAKEKAQDNDRITELTAAQQNIVRTAMEKQPPITESETKRLSELQSNRKKERIKNDKSNPRLKTKETKSNTSGGSSRGGKKKEKGVLFNSMGYPQRVEDLPD